MKRRGGPILLFLGSGLIAVSLGLLLVPRATIDSPASVDGFSLAPDHGGPIARVVTSLSSARRSALRNVELLNSIVNGLPSQVDIWVLVDDRAAFSLEDESVSRKVRFVELEHEGGGLTIWPQDPFLVLRGPAGQVRLLASNSFERAGDDRMAAAFAEALSAPVEVSDLSFEGGNIVSDESRVFIGANTIRSNAVAMSLGESEVVRIFEAELGRGVLVIGPAPQPIGHIDMMLTPLGDNRVALADPSRGAAIAARVLEESPESVSEFERVVVENFFGSPLIESLELADGSLIEPPPLMGATPRAIEYTRSLIEPLEKIAKELESRGLEVVRVPYLAGPGLEGERPSPGNRERIPSSGPSRSEEVARHDPHGPGYPALTYNNVLIESRAEGDFVYLPRYGFAELDAAAARTWANAGFVPRPIDELVVPAAYGGALRCSVKIIDRQLQESGTS